MKCLVSILFVFLANLAIGQHEHHPPAPPKKKVQTEKKKPAAPQKKAPAKKAPAAKPAPQKSMTSQPDTGQAAPSATPAPGHQHHLQHQDTVQQKSPAQQDTAHYQHTPQHEQHADSAHAHPPMSHAFSLHLPMNRNGSGTGWLPDESPMYGKMLHNGNWMYMLHGNLFLRFNYQDIGEVGTRGDRQVDVPFWLMFMGQRKVGQNGLLHFSIMSSLDVLSTGGRGYPLLFQSGESYQGEPLIDRQHPHDLFSELSLSYSHSFSEATDAYIYIGYPGEPALGPVAFMHRPSSQFNPDAPLSHHWVDATHITFGVVTAGIRHGNVKLEGSTFTGREPDENRYNFDRPRFDSRSGRVSVNLSKKLSFQASSSFLKSPEVFHEGKDVYRSTTSLVYSNMKGAETWLSWALVYGRNKSPGHDAEQSILAEAAWKRNRWGLFTRAEWVEKSAEELVLPEEEFEHDRMFPISHITAGWNYDLLSCKTFRMAVGNHVTIFNTPDGLEGDYGSYPVAVQAYARIYPALMQMR